MNRRRFIKTALIYVPTIFACNQGIARLGNLEPEVGKWRKRITDNSAGYTSKSIVCNDVMTKLLKAYGLRSRIVRMNTFTGIGINAIKVPLIIDVNPSTLDNINPLGNPFVDGDFTEGTGVTGNGTNKIIWSGTKFSDLIALADGYAYSAYVCASNNQSGFTMGIYQGSDFTYLYVSNGAGHSFFAGGVTSNQIDVVDSAGSGFYCGSYYGPGNQKLFKRGVEIGNHNSPGTPGDFVYWIGIFDCNNQNSAIVAPSSKTLGGYSCSKSIAAADQPKLNDVWQRGMTILGRAVV